MGNWKLLRAVLYISFSFFPLNIHVVLKVDSKLIKVGITTVHFLLSEALAEFEQNLNEPGLEKTCLMSYANNEC